MSDPLAALDRKRLPQQPRWWLGSDECSYYLSSDDVPTLDAALAWYEAEVGEPWLSEDALDPPSIEKLPCCDTHEAGDPVCTPSCQTPQRVWAFEV